MKKNRQRLVFEEQNLDSVELVFFGVAWVSIAGSLVATNIMRTNSLVLAC